MIVPVNAPAAPNYFQRINSPKPFLRILELLPKQDVESVTVTCRQWHNMTRLSEWKEVLEAESRECELPPSTKGIFLTGPYVACRDYEKLYFRDRQALKDESETIDVKNRYRLLGGMESSHEIAVFGPTMISSPRVIESRPVVVVNKKLKRSVREIDLNSRLQTLPDVLGWQHCVIKAFGTEKANQPLNLITNGGYLFKWDNGPDFVFPDGYKSPEGYIRWEVTDVKQMGTLLCIVARYIPDDRKEHLIASYDLETGAKRILLHPVKMNLEIAVDRASQTLVISFPSRIACFKVEENGLKETAQLSVTDLTRCLEGCFAEFHDTTLSVNRYGVAFSFLTTQSHTVLDRQRLIGFWNLLNREVKIIQGDYFNMFEDLLVAIDEPLGQAVQLRFIHLPTAHELHNMKLDNHDSIRDVFIPDGKPRNITVQYNRRGLNYLRFYERPVMQQQRVPATTTPTITPLPQQPLNSTPSCFRSFLQRLFELLRRIFYCFRRQHES